jgi:putative MATE family efflux protein
LKDKIDVPTSKQLVNAPLLPTLIMLSLPNVMALSAQSIVAIVETKYIGKLGTEALAAMALVFPLIMLTQMLSSGSMGGGVSSAMSRALGAGDERRARAIATHAIGLGLAGGLMMSCLFLLAGPSIYKLLGGTGEVLQKAIVYSKVFFFGAVFIWLFNTLASISRGTGNMGLPSATIVGLGTLQIVLGGILCLGVGPFQGIGLPGVAMGQILAFATGSLFLLWQLSREMSLIRLTITGIRFDWAICRDILKVGAIACFSPLQTILIAVFLARCAAYFDTQHLAGFGIGLRLELLLVPLAFAIGVACVPMVGMAIGAGNVARARRVAWTGACLSGLLIGAIGLALSHSPSLWGSLFTDDPHVLAAVDEYLKIAGVGFPAYGFGLCLYFASQGSGKILGPVLGGTIRLIVVTIGGLWLVNTESTFAALATLVLVSMLAYGGATALFVYLTTWSRSDTTLDTPARAVGEA